MKRLLVTGGCGFIGSNFIRFLFKNKLDFSVINLDKLTYAGNLDNLKEMENRSNYRFVHGDVCDSKLVSKLVSEVDWIIHFASETHVDRSIDSSEIFFQTNVIGTQVLLESIRVQGRTERFIYFSTDEVYGSRAAGEFSEDSPIQPTSPYAASKASADLTVQAYQKTYRIPAIILRGCNHFGPYQYPEKVIPLFITNLIEGKKIPLYSKGENSREWLFVEDSCRAIMLAFEKGTVGESYNVGSGYEVNNRALATMILSEFGCDESKIQYVPDRLAHDLRYRLNSDKIIKLGFKITDQFETKLKETIDWYRCHESWWKKLKIDRFTLK